MKKILVFGAFLAVFCNAFVDAAVRDGTNPSRNPKTQQRISTTVKADSARTTVVKRKSNDSARGGTNTMTRNAVVSRVSTTPQTRSGAARATRGAFVSRAAKTQSKAKIARAGTNDTLTPETSTNEATETLNNTRTGTIYEQCKSAYFQCMDQFCQLKNDDYRRCSCSDRVIDLAEIRQNLTDTNEKLTEFTDNLSVVGLTTAQATAMKTASDGENALTADTSASKALLQAIMNTIRGEEGKVGGKMSALDSIDISFDTANAFGITDSAQLVAAYNGTALYNAVYPNCRKAVKNDCNDASLQRAVTAYLMAVEQDCNTVQTALTNKQKELKSSIREGSAMLDLARIENRKKHNSDDLTACINNIQAAIQSEEVCGENYHKCLDNGQFIDVSTGAPITGVTNFFELGNLLKFAEGVNAASQKLSSVPHNRAFVTNFEKITKKFAQDSLDKCTEIADIAWQNYLDKALLDIYYAQQSKVTEIQQGCFDLITNCYSDRDAAITAAMQNLIEGANVPLMPNKIALTKTMCSDYIESCDKMFDHHIVENYMNLQKDTDVVAACRAVVQQCFTKYGGPSYENFYNPNNGLFIRGAADSIVSRAAGDTISPDSAIDWFTLYSYDDYGRRETIATDSEIPKYVSPCAQEVYQIENCSDKMETVFGGLDRIMSVQNIDGVYGNYIYAGPGGGRLSWAYGWVIDDLLTTTNGVPQIRTEATPTDVNSINSKWFQFNRSLRPYGIASSVYNNILDKLINDCSNMQGKFVESQFINHNFYKRNDICHIGNAASLRVNENYTNRHLYFIENENICPKAYADSIDVDSWGACQCWENGGRRSFNGVLGKCELAVYYPYGRIYQECSGTIDNSNCTSLYGYTGQDWICYDSGNNPTCNFYYESDDDDYDDRIYNRLPFSGGCAPVNACRAIETSDSNNQESSNNTPDICYMQPSSNTTVGGNCMQNINCESRVITDPNLPPEDTYEYALNTTYWAVCKSVDPGRNRVCPNCNPNSDCASIPYSIIPLGVGGTEEEQE